MATLNEFQTAIVGQCIARIVPKNDDQNGPPLRARIMSNPTDWGIWWVYRDYLLERDEDAVAIFDFNIAGCS